MDRHGELMAGRKIYVSRWPMNAGEFACHIQKTRNAYGLVLGSMLLALLGVKATCSFGLLCVSKT